MTKEGIYEIVITKLYQKPMEIVGCVSGRTYMALGEGYHPDHEGKYDPAYCEGFYLTDISYVHFDLAKGDKHSIEGDKALMSSNRLGEEEEAKKELLKRI